MAPYLEYASEVITLHMCFHVRGHMVLEGLQKHIDLFAPTRDIGKGNEEIVVSAENVRLQRVGDINN